MGALKSFLPVLLAACVDCGPQSPSPEELEKQRVELETARRLFTEHDGEIREKIISFMRTQEFQERHEKCQKKLDRIRLEKGDQAALPLTCEYKRVVDGETTSIAVERRQVTTETARADSQRTTVRLAFADSEGSYHYAFEPDDFEGEEGYQPKFFYVAVQPSAADGEYTVLNYQAPQYPYDEKGTDLTQAQKALLRLVESQTYLSAYKTTEEMKADQALQAQLEALAPEISKAIRESRACKQKFLKKLEKWRRPHDALIEESFGCEEIFEAEGKRNLSLHWGGGFTDEDGILRFDLTLEQPRPEGTFEWSLDLHRGQLYDSEGVAVRGNGGAWEYDKGMMHTDSPYHFAGPYASGEKTAWVEQLFADFTSGLEKYDLRDVPFDVDAYRAPTGGTVQRVKGQKEGKVVMFLPDMHVEEESSRALNLEAQKVQNYQARVLEGLADQYGHFDLVLENVAREMPQELLIAAFEDAPPLQGEFISSTALFLPKHPHAARVVGPINLEEIDVLLEHLSAIGKFEHPETVPCSNAPNGTSIKP